MGDSVAVTEDCPSVPFCNSTLLEYSIGYWGRVGVTLFAKFPKCLKFRHTASATIYYLNAQIMPFREWAHFVQLHAPTTVPKGPRAQLLTDDNHEISYSQVTVNRQPPPYNTGCRHYEPDGASGVMSGTNSETLSRPTRKPQSQSDCIAICLLEQATNTTTESFNYFFMDYDSFFMKRDQFSPKAMMSAVMKDSGGDELDLREIEEECENSCAPDCTYRFYPWTTALRKSVPGRDNVIKLKHNFDSDMIYSHVPAIDLFAFFGNVGGLAGMWIGFSFLSVWCRMAAYANLIERKQSRKALGRKIRLERQDLRRERVFY